MQWHTGTRKSIQFTVYLTRVQNRQRSKVDNPTRDQSYKFIVLFGPTLAAMYFSVLFSKKFSKRMQALQRSLFDSGELAVTSQNLQHRRKQVTNIRKNANLRHVSPDHACHLSCCVT